MNQADELLVSMAALQIVMDRASLAAISQSLKTIVEPSQFVQELILSIDGFVQVTRDIGKEEVMRQLGTLDSFNTDDF